MPPLTTSFLPLISHLDLFKTPIIFFFDSRLKSSTKIGVFLSLGLIILLLYSFSKSDFILKQSPFIVSQTITNPHASPINFNDDKLMSIAVSHSNNLNYIGDGIFTIGFSLVHYKSNNNGVFEFDYEIDLELKLCDEEDVAFDPDLFNIMGMTNAYCLKNKTFLLEGYWDESEIYYAWADLYLCDNETSNNSCQSQEAIDDFFSTSKYFGCIFPGAALQITDYLNPLKQKYEVIYQLIDLKVMKELQFFFKTLELIKNDGGWFFSQSQTDQSFLRDSMNFDFSFRGDQDALSVIVFYASHDSDQNIRRYQTSTEALASLSGTANLYLFFCFIITNFQNYIQTLQTLLNSLYYFPNPEEEKENDQSSINSQNKENKKRLKINPILFKTPIQINTINNPNNPFNNEMKLHMDEDQSSIQQESILIK